MIRGLIAAAAWLAASLEWTAAATPEELFESGKTSFYEAHNAPAATQALEGSLKAGLSGKPREECTILLAEAYWSAGNPRAALWLYGREIAEGKNELLRSDALYRRATCSMAQNDAHSGMADFADFAHRYPQENRAPKALIFQANYAVLEGGNLPVAIRLYEQIALSYPKSPEAKAALEWLPKLRKMSPADLRKQLAQYRAEEKAAIEKAKKSKQAKTKK